MSERARYLRNDVWIYAGAWTALATIYAAALITNRVPADVSFRNAIANLLPDALVGLAVLRLPSELPWPEKSKARFFATHAGLLVAFLVIAAAGWMMLVVIDTILFTGTFNAVISYRILPFRILNGVLIYCSLAAVGYARQNAAAVREQAERAARAEALRARASLEALRSQLNPHFILNTYHALLGLVRRDPAVAESALERLGDLLRYSLRVHRDGIDEVPLREERAFVESYLELERLRLADRLRVSIETPEATMESLVPTFSIQILVENAIRHAIAPRASGGLLQIRAESTGGLLRVAVTDEGTGEAVEDPLEGSRMGLRLLHERLAALYGDAARLTLRRTNNGTCAELELPARSVPEEES